MIIVCDERPFYAVPPVKTFVCSQHNKNCFRGNEYISLYSAFQVNAYYSYVISFTVFTSTIKLSKFLSFQKAFMQVRDQIRVYLHPSPFANAWIVIHMELTVDFPAINVTKPVIEQDL